MRINFLVEGPTDEAVARILTISTGHEPGVCYGKRGKGYIEQNIKAFSASHSPGECLLAMVDGMDFREPCASALVAKLLPYRPEQTLLRIVVRELESWLLSDAEGFSSYFAVPLNKLPPSPETLVDPKQTLVNLARRSRLKRIRVGLVPGDGMSSSTGPDYTPEIENYVRTSWDIGRARRNAPSLDRCWKRLKELPK